jgi:transposase
MGKEGSKTTTPEKVVQDIRRKTRRRFSAEEKIRIVLEGLRGEEGIATLCRKEGLAPNLYYRWSKEFFEAGKKRLVGDTAREATSTEVVDLRKEHTRLKQVVAEIVAVLYLRAARDLLGHPRLCAHAGGAVSSDDAGQDRALPSLAEERREARSLLHALGAGTGDCPLRGGLQSPAVSRVAAERDAGGHVPGPPSDDPGASRSD